MKGVPGVPERFRRDRVDGAVWTDTHNVRCVAVANAEYLMSGRDAERLGMLKFDQPEVSKYSNNNRNCFYDKLFNRKRKFEFSRTKSRTRVVSLVVDKRNKKSLFPGLDEKNIRVTPLTIDFERKSEGNSINIRKPKKNERI